MPRRTTQNGHTQQEIAEIVHNYRLLLEELRGRTYDSLPSSDRIRVDRDFLRNPRTAIARLLAHRQGSSLRSARSYLNRFEERTGHDAATGQRVRRVNPNPPVSNTPVQPTPTNQPPPVSNPPVPSDNENENQSPFFYRNRWAYSSADIASEHARYNPELDERRAMIRRQMSLGGTREDAIRRHDRILRIRQLKELKENTLSLKGLGKQFRGLLGIVGPMAIARAGFSAIQDYTKVSTANVKLNAFKDLFKISAPKGREDFEKFADAIMSQGGTYEDAMDIWSKEVTWASGLKYKIGTDRLRQFGMILGKEPSLDVINNPEKQIPWLMENLRKIDSNQAIALQHAGLSPLLIQAARRQGGPLSGYQMLHKVSERARFKKEHTTLGDGKLRWWNAEKMPSAYADALSKYQEMTPEQRKRVKEARAPVGMFGAVPSPSPDYDIKKAIEMFPQIAKEIESRSPNGFQVEVNMKTENNFPEGDYDPEDVKNSVQYAIEAGSQKIVEGMYGAFTNLGVTEGY